jgi:hypothetical protein
MERSYHITLLTLTSTAHPIVWAGREIAEPFRRRCINEVFPTPAKQWKMTISRKDK